MEDTKLHGDVKLQKDVRLKDPFMDRREAYDLDYFQSEGVERRMGEDRRQDEERRDNCIRVSKWTSICPDDLE